MAKTTVMFMGTVPFEAELDGTVVFRTYLDGVTDDSATTRVYFERGGHVVSLTNYFPMAANGRSTLKVTAVTEFFESDYRKDHANIVSLLNYVNSGAFVATPVDADPPSITVKKSSIKGLLFAQGIAGAGQWDGTINLADEFRPVSVDKLTPFDAINVGQFVDRVNVQTVHVMKTGLAQNLDTPIIIEGGYAIGNFAESTEFERKEIPHGDGYDGFSPIMVGVSKIVIGSMSDTPTTEINE